MEDPTLAAITLDATGGGIAAVSRLLWRVLQDRWGSRAHLLTLFQHDNHPATLAEKARFTVALTSAEALGRTDWVLFSHLALADPQHAIPSRLRRPYGIFLHGIEAWCSLPERAQETLAGADVRIANSRYTADRVMERHPGIGHVDACPLALLPADELSNSMSSVPVPFLPGSPTVLTVGRMATAERYKGHDQLIDVWPHVVARIPDATLVIAGDGDDADRLRQKASDSPAHRRIVFTGFVPRTTLDGLYKHASLFALPSRGEGFGLVYLEAMSHRLACIGSVHDAAGEIIVNGETGRLVDQGDEAGLADAITSLLAEPAERERLGEAGHRRVFDEFSFERFSERLHRLLPASVTSDASAPA